MRKAIHAADFAEIVAECKHGEYIDITQLFARLNAPGVIRNIQGHGINNPEKLLKAAEYNLARTDYFVATLAEAAKFFGIAPGSLNSYIRQGIITIPKEPAPAKYKRNPKFARGGYDCKKALRTLKKYLDADKFAYISTETRASIEAELHPKMHPKLNN